MLAPQLWLAPVASEYLRSVSQLTCGDVPCSSAALASLLEGTTGECCTGLLSDASVRSDLAKQLKGASSGVQVSSKGAEGLVDALAAVLEARVEAIRKKSAAILKALPAGDKMPTFEEIKKALPAGAASGDALKRDWLVWHVVGNKYEPKTTPPPTAKVLKERIALQAAGAADSVACPFAVGAHVLENLDAYIKWEASFPGNGSTKSLAVLIPFDKATADEVVVRRVLATVVPVEAATSISGAGGKPLDVMKKMVATARAEAVLPMYAAPPAPAEKGERVKDAKGKEAKGKPAKAAAGGNFAAAQAALSTQELQWHLLRYRMAPRTTLSSAPAPAATGKKGAPAAASAGKGAKPAAAASSSQPAGFAGLWSPSGVGLPPGHTQYSWHHADDASDSKSTFARTWAPTARAPLPPGHTDYSWERVAASSAGKSGSSSSAAAPAAKAPAQAKGKAKAAAKPAAAPAAKGANPPEGSQEASLCKLDIRCGMIDSCEKAPDSDKLFLLKVNIGGGETRQVITGLQKHYKAEELQKRKVVVYCNIKPAKLAGLASEAMVLAGTRNKGTDDEICEVLAPPDVEPGTRAVCGSYEVGCLSETQSVKHISKVWNAVTPELKVNTSKEATFAGTTLTMGGSPITIKSLTEVPIS